VSCVGGGLGGGGGGRSPGWVGIGTVRTSAVDGLSVSYKGRQCYLGQMPCDVLP
jgi:hypothetical protein